MSPCLKYFGSVSGLLDVYLTIIPREFSKDSMGQTNTTGDMTDDQTDCLAPMPVTK